MRAMRREVVRGCVRSSGGAAPAPPEYLESKDGLKVEAELTRRALGAAARFGGAVVDEILGFAAGMTGDEGCGLGVEAMALAHLPDHRAGMACGGGDIHDRRGIGFVQDAGRAGPGPRAMQIGIGQIAQFGAPAAGEAACWVLVMALFDGVVDARRVHACGA